MPDTVAVRVTAFLCGTSKCASRLMWVRTFRGNLRPLKVILMYISASCTVVFTLFQLHVGETALAFYRAKNNSDKPIIGVASYNVVPPRAGLYFNKVQCFCFDEQRLMPGEEVCSFDGAL